MKRRLLKKLRLGEFQEFGFEVSFDILAELSEIERNAVLDGFITGAVEANGLQYGGGGDRHWRGFVTLNKPLGSATEAHREAVKLWLQRNASFENVIVGELRDAWHGWEED